MAMVPALRGALLLCIGLVIQQAPRASAFRLHANKAAVRTTSETSDVAAQELGADIAKAFGGSAMKNKRTKGGKGGGHGGGGGIMGFLQKMALKTVANQVFKQFDADRNGHLDARELTNALGAVTRKIGINAPHSMIQASLQMFDCDGSGTLDQYEFYLMCRQLHFLMGGGTAKHHKVKSVKGCHGHMPAGGLPHGHRRGARYGGPGYGHPGHGHPGLNPGYPGPGHGPVPGYNPVPGYVPGLGYGSNPGPGYNPGSGYAPGRPGFGY